MATKPRKSTRTAPPARPAWLVFIGGIATGVFATLLVTTFAVPRRAAPAAVKPAGAGAVAAVATPSSPTYEFDRVLQSSEVPVRGKNAPVTPAVTQPGVPQPGVPQPAVVQPPPPATALTPAAPAGPDDAPLPQRMLLQAGSFRAAGDADSLRAELLLLAVGAVTTRDTLLPSGDVWHRVLIGPFKDAATMRAIQDRLSRQNIDTFPIAAPRAAARPTKPAAAAAP